MEQAADNCVQVKGYSDFKLAHQALERYPVHCASLEISPNLDGPWVVQFMGISPDSEALATWLAHVKLVGKVEVTVFQQNLIGSIFLPFQAH